jgi:hypothetical protein
LKSLITLQLILLEELGRRCDTSTTLDRKLIERRFEHEGLSFLAITLPTYCQDFERSLDTGRVDDVAFRSFSRCKGLPQFLGGFLRLVFDESSGLLLDEPNVDAIRAIRQLTLMFGKIKRDCTPKRQSAALTRYIECEEDVRSAEATLLNSEVNYLSDFRRISQLLWRDFLGSVDTSIYNQGVIPKHGPGATADKLRGNAKYNQLTWTRRLEEVFPHWEYLIPSESFLDRTDNVAVLDPSDEIPTRVILVRKTLKTPRIIAIEPTCMQYMQQGILATIVDEIPRHDNTRHFIDFEFQEPNQRLAKEGSLTGALATLDLSEASDRVSNQHVRLLLSRNSILREAVDACRSRKADVPGHGVIPLTKFASMGSALCFPFEALVFCTIVFMGIEEGLAKPLTMRDIKSMYGKVRVYGDDIIVPTEFVLSVKSRLEAFGLKVNTKKSFWTGRFRESCGKEYYAGVDVCIARQRDILPSGRRDVEELVSAVSLRNQLFELGYVDSVRFLDDMIGKIIPFPYVLETSTLLGRLSHTHFGHVLELPCQESRWDDQLQIPLVRGAVVKSIVPASLLDDYGALMKCLLKQGDQPFVDRDHLLRSGRAVSPRIKIRWASPF